MMPPIKVLKCFVPLERRAHHVSEVCTEGARGLVVLHHTVVVEDLSTAVTEEGERERQNRNREERKEDRDKKRMG